MLQQHLDLSEYEIQDMLEVVTELKDQKGMNDKEVMEYLQTEYPYTYLEARQILSRWTANWMRGR